MAKKKKKRKLRARTLWTLSIGYFLAGFVVAVFYLNQNAPSADEVEAAQQGMNNAWGLLPIIVKMA